MTKRHIPFLVSLCALATLASCARHKQEDTPLPTATTPRESLSAVVSILPQAYFLERVGGDRVAVEVLVRPGQSPATYEPTPRQMAALSKADVYFRIGVPFENALAEKITASLPALNVVDTREGIELRPIGGPPEHAHEGGPHSEFHGAMDPHIWLDPNLVKVQARTMKDELVRLDAGNAELYDRNLAAFEADLDAVDQKIADALAPLKGSEILVFHPAYGYFADAYGLRQVAIETEGKEPSARQLAEIIRRAKREGARMIFAQPEFSTASAEAIAEEIGAAVVPIDPLARDYLANLEDMADKIKASLASGSR